MGEISDVVQTEQGMHLIKLTDRKPGQPSEFAKIQEEVLELCDLELHMAILESQCQAAKIQY